MQKAPIPKNEKERLCSVMDLNLLDTAPEERFDKITRQATARFGVPISTITIIDKNREWFKSSQGLTSREGPRDISFCGHALLQQNIFIVEDTLKNPLFADNPMVVNDPHIRFYAGKSLFEHKSNLPVGVFCIKDYKPRTMGLRDIADFLDFAERAEKEINIKMPAPKKSVK